MFNVVVLLPNFEFDADEEIVEIIKDFEELKIIYETEPDKDIKEITNYK